MDAGTDEYELNGVLPPGTPGSPDASPPRWGLRHRPINVNHYANKKSAAESMLDIALLMANASQLKAVVEQGPSFAFYVPLVVLISISLALQIGVGVLLIFLVKYDLNNPAKHAKLDFLNNLATGLVFIIVVVNIFITAFGVQKPLMDMAPQQTLDATCPAAQLPDPRSRYTREVSTSLHVALPRLPEPRLASSPPCPRTSPCSDCG
ncbi:Ninjurin-1 [Plecturocebus cupreus]